MFLVEFFPSEVSIRAVLSGLVNRMKVSHSVLSSILLEQGMKLFDYIECYIYRQAS